MIDIGLKKRVENDSTSLKTVLQDTSSDGMIDLRHAVCDLEGFGRSEDLHQLKAESTLT